MVVHAELDVIFPPGPAIPETAAPRKARTRIPGHLGPVGVPPPVEQPGAVPLGESAGSAEPVHRSMEMTVPAAFAKSTAGTSFICRIFKPCYGTDRDSPCRCHTDVIRRPEHRVCTCRDGGCGHCRGTKLRLMPPCIEYHPSFKPASIVDKPGQAGRIAEW